MTDQEQFDQQVQTVGKKVLFWLFGVLSILALFLSLAAFANEPKQAPQYVTVKQYVTKTVQVATPVPTKTVALKVGPSWKKGPDGKLHDAFSVTSFHLTAGKAITLRITNFDTVPHSITSPQAGVDIVAQPGTHDYTLNVSKPGTYVWFCRMGCDPWSMAHLGYMRGTIVVS
jgi:heme/copper-type cytochrome/quinol oxidase subunit 2